MSGARTVTKQSETRERVLDLIERLGVGDAIPSERQLSSGLGVSRLTSAPRSTTSSARAISCVVAAAAPSSVSRRSRRSSR